MSDVTQSELLINALLDGQLDAAEAERVSKQIAGDKQLSEMLAAFKAQRAAFAQLPEYELKDRFADRVLEIAAAEAAARPMLNRPPASSVDWKKYAMTLAAIAGLLFGMLVYQWTPLSNPDGPTVAVLSSGAKPTSAKDQAIVDSLGDTSRELAVGGGGVDEEELQSSAAGREGSALAKISSPLAQAQAGAGVSAEPSAPERLRATSSGVASAPKVDSRDYISFSGTPMASSPNQSQQAIDQVWLLEVQDGFSQGQLLEALTSNSISVPAELEQTPAVAFNEDVNQRAQDVDGIHVTAKPLQMKNALSQLSQSDAVTISAFHLPSEPTQQDSGVSVATGKQSEAPLSIEPPQLAIAQKLRGNYFAQRAPRPSSLVPESFDKLEQKMGIVAEEAAEEDATAEVAPEVADAKIDREQSKVDAPTQPAAEMEMEQLFPGSTLESDRLQNFLILIRNQAPSNK